jgi:hypothetical protein
MKLKTKILKLIELIKLKLIIIELIKIKLITI